MEEQEPTTADIEELEATNDRLVKMGLAEAATLVSNTLAEKRAAIAVPTPARAKRELDQAERFEKRAQSFLTEANAEVQRLEEHLAMAMAAREEAERQHNMAASALRQAIARHAEFHVSAPSPKVVYAEVQELARTHVCWPKSRAR